jgi:hypothetical protein
MFATGYSECTALRRAVHVAGALLLSAMVTPALAANSFGKADLSCSSGSACSVTLPALDGYTRSISCEWNSNNVTRVDVAFVAKGSSNVQFLYPFVLSADERTTRAMLRFEAEDYIYNPDLTEMKVTLRLSRSGPLQGTCYRFW